jgi:excinuclease UvrABC nuclease subunit
MMTTWMILQEGTCEVFFMVTMDNVRNGEILSNIDFYSFSKENVKALKGESGVYFLFDGSFNLLYIGKSVYFKQRFRQHMRGDVPATKDYLQEIKWFGYILVKEIPYSSTKGKLELKLIHKLRPKLNIETKLHEIFDGW